MLTKTPKKYESRTWKLADAAWFRRTKDPFGIFSNFALRMPIQLHGFEIPSSEHLYQAMRFPHLPEVQFQILEADSPKTSKTIARGFDASSRDDWMEIRIDVMRWVLAKKILCNASRMAKAFDRSGDKPIVEYSKRDPFWGCAAQRGQRRSARRAKRLGMPAVGAAK